MSRGKAGRIDKDLKKAVKDLLKKVTDDEKATTDEKCKAIDRALKLAAIEAKIDDPGYGSGFTPTEDD